MNESSIRPIVSFDEQDSIKEELFNDILKAPLQLPHDKTTNSSSKNILLISNERKGSILKRPIPERSGIMNFERSDVKHRTVAFSNLNKKTEKRGS